MRRRFADLALAAAIAAALASPLLGANAGTLVVANKSDATVDLIDLATGRSLATLPTGRGPHEVAVSADGRTAAVSDYGDRANPGSSLTLVDVPGARVVDKIPLGPHTRPHGLAWVSDRLLAVTTEGSAHLLTVDVAERRIRSKVATGQEVSHMVALGSGGRRAFVANIGSGTVTAIDLERGVKLADLATGEGAEGIAVTPDGREAWVGNRGADTLTVLDAETLETLATLPCPGFPIRVEITPDGARVLVSAARSGEVVLFDAAARKELLRRKLDFATVPDAARRLFGDQFGESPVPVGLVISPDGATAWVAATQADVVVAIDVATLRVKGLLTAGREPDGMAWSPLNVEK